MACPAKCTALPKIREFVRSYARLSADLVCQQRRIHPYALWSKIPDGPGQYIRAPSLQRSSRGDGSRKELEVLGCEFMPAFINERLEGMPAEPLFDLSFIKPFVTTEDRVPLKITLTGGATSP